MAKQVSLNAKKVAQDIAKSVGDGQLINVYEVQKNAGYSHQSAKAHKALKTKTFIQEFAKYEDVLRPKLEDLSQGLADKIFVKMQEDNKNTMRDYAYTFDLLNKHINLMQGKSTEIVQHNFESEEDATKFIEGELRK